MINDSDLQCADVPMTRKEKTSLDSCEKDAGDKLLLRIWQIRIVSQWFPNADPGFWFRAPPPQA